MKQVFVLIPLLVTSACGGATTPPRSTMPRSASIIAPAEIDRMRWHRSRVADLLVELPDMEQFREACADIHALGEPAPNRALEDLYADCHGDGRVDPARWAALDQTVRVAFLTPAPELRQKRSHLALAEALCQGAGASGGPAPPPGFDGGVVTPDTPITEAARAAIETRLRPTCDGLARAATAIGAARHTALQALPTAEQLERDRAALGVPVPERSAPTTQGLNSAAILGTEASSVLDVVLRGLAQFLVARAGAELEAFVVDRIRTTLCAEATDLAGAIRTELLSATCAFLASSELSLGTTLGESFEAAVLSDLVAAPRSLRNALLHPEFGIARTCSGAATASCDDCFQGLLAVVALETAAGILETTTPERLASGLDEAIDQYVQQLGADRRSPAGPVRSASCAPPQPDTSATVSRVEDIARAAALFRLVALSPSTQTAEEMRVAVGRLLGEALSSQRQTALLELTTHLAGVRRALQGLEVRPADDDQSPEQQREVRRSRVEPIATAVVGAINAVIALAADDPSTTFRLPSSIPALLGAFASADPARIAAALVRSFAEILERIPATDAPIAVPAAVVRVIALGTELAGAADADDAAQIIQSYAAPAGSWRLKSQRPLISLTGIVGIGAGYEYLFPSARLSGVHMGSVAPTGFVGIDITDNFDNRSGSWGLFVSIIDLGALLDFGIPASELTVHTAVDNLMVDGPRLDISPFQFLSPGLFLRFSSVELPLIFGAGVEVMPYGRTVLWDESVDGGDAVARAENVPVIRGLVFAGVDVTIFPF